MPPSIARMTSVQSAAGGGTLSAETGPALQLDSLIVGDSTWEVVDPALDFLTTLVGGFLISTLGSIDFLFLMTFLVQLGVLSSGAGSLAAS